MKKLKIYLDTCVIGYLDQQDDPGRMAETHRLWERLKAGEYDVVISDVTIEELNRCHDQRRDKLLQCLAQISFERVIVDDQTLAVAEKFVDLGILKKKSFDDCRHIAAAIVFGCDAIVSWNFKHIANPRTIVGTKAVTTLSGYKDLLIFTPTFLIEEGDDNDS
ncbi:MAG: PIN domain-containing protein [Oscillospiraceae bacterium]|nr:PIN domain-containing protein [Oscillospiraceae bacterium]